MHSTVDYPEPKTLVGKIFNWILLVCFFVFLPLMAACGGPSGPRDAICTNKASGESFEARVVYFGNGDIRYYSFFDGNGFEKTISRFESDGWSCVIGERPQAEEESEERITL